MKILSTLLITSLTLTTAAFAQEPNQEEESDQKEESEYPNNLYSQSSQALRQNKQAAILVGIGMRTDNLSEASISYMHFLDPDVQIVANYTNLDSKIKEDAGENDDGERLVYVGISTEVKGSALSAGVRRFFGNSFYVEGGLDYASVEAKFVIDETIFLESAEVDLGSYKKLSAYVQIGNQWQWENFTLGTSWVGLLLPLSMTKDFTTEAKTGKSGLNSIESFINGAEDPQASALRFHIGWAF